MKNKVFTLVDWQRILNIALKSLYKNDSHLMKVRSSERSISHKLAQHIETALDNNSLNVDCEYNRNYLAPKSLDSLDQNVLPDIIIHIRGTDENKLVIEIKIDGDFDTDDRKKVKAYINELNYEYGLVLVISSSKAEGCKREWWINKNSRAEKHIPQSEQKVGAKHTKNIFEFGKKIGIKNFGDVSPKDTLKYSKRIKQKT